jgi:Fur family transcriptional regulator, ferric uptake regulator
MSARNTRQQQAIREVFHQAMAPLSPRDVLKRARSRVPSMSQATVYRGIRRLLDEQTIVTVQLPGQPPLYEQAGKGHHHFFRCRKCHEMYEVQGCDELVDRLVPRGFSLEDHDVFLFGLCSQCR